ncbi:MAG: mechanosensitive ion channel domain-containing protein [Qingshengfaniella sp.]
MRLFLRLLLIFGLLTGSAAAQVALPGAGGSTSGATSDTPADTSVDTLIGILEDETARTALIDTLRGAAAEAPPASASAPAQTPGIAQLAAEYTRSTAEQVARILRSGEQLLTTLTQAVQDTSRIDLSRLTQVATHLAVAMAVVFGTFLILRLIAFGLTARLARRAAARPGWMTRLALLIPTATLEIGCVLLAWAGGYGYSLIFGTSEQIAIYQTLFLNAFLINECAKLLMRLVIMPRHQDLRLIPLDDTGASYWHFWISRAVSLLGYGLLFAVPVLSIEISAGVGLAIREITILLTVLILILLILQNREPVRAALRRRAEDGAGGMLGRGMGVLSNHWHQLTILYLLVFVTLWLTDPGEAVQFMIRATLRSAAAVIAGMIVMAVLSRLIALGLRLPEDLRTRLPLLEPRLNAFVPSLLRGVRAVVFLAVILSIVDAWHLLDVAGWVLSADGRSLIGRLLGAAAILLAGAFIYLAMTSWVEYRLNPEVGSIPTTRQITLLSLLRNALTILLCIILMMMVLAQLGMNIAPLIAGAGVFGLAISFGAQKFVQDVITGAFIQLENAMNTGDVVTLGGTTGMVERLSIRSVSLRSADGSLHFIPFSSVDMVSNFTKHFSYYLIDMGVAYRENITEVKAAMREAFERLCENEELAVHILEDLDLLGVTAFADSAVVVRARIKTVPGMQWLVGRAYNERLKEVFDAQNIEIPFPHVTLYMGEGKQGMAPPLRMVEPEKG